MGTAEQRRPLQKKIVTYIITVGVFPMVLALLVGYLGLRISLLSQPALPKIIPLVLIGACFVGLAFLLICLVFALLRVHRNVVQPVQLLYEGVELIRSGDLDLKLKIKTNDEIEDLAVSFNRMALELKKNIQKLGESEEKYRGLVTSIKEGIYQVDAEGRLSFVNKAAADIFGFESTEEMLGVKYSELYFDPSDYDEFLQLVEEKGFVSLSNVRMKKRDGQQIWVATSSNFVVDKDGKPVGHEGIFSDVTERVRLEEASQEKARRIAVLNEIANAINSTLDSGLIYETIAAEIKKLVAFDYAAITLIEPSQKRGEKYYLLPEKRKMVANGDDFDSGELAGSKWVLENEQPLMIADLQNDSGMLDNTELQKLGVRTALFLPLRTQEKIAGTFDLGNQRANSFTDYDLEVLQQMAGQIAVAVQNARLFENLQRSYQEVKRAQEQLTLANEQLKSLDQVKTNLLSNVSHELRTPLVSVMGYTDMILSEKVGKISPVQREYLSISLRNVEKLVALIENLLDFSRLHRGTEVLNYQSFDVVKVAAASLNLIRPAADEKEVNLQMETTGERFEVEGDPAKISQVFTNLLTNAVKFNNKDGSIFVRINSSDNKAARISIQDTGIGIPPEAQDKIFQRFYQYDDSSTRKYGGTGIGLAIVHDIIRLHGSSITVKSETGKGSTFTFSLSLSDTEKEEPVKRKARKPEFHALVELVVRDNYLANTLKVQLGHEGLNVMEAPSSESALEIAQKHMPDCLIIEDDVVRELGMSYLHQFKESKATRRIPIVLVQNSSAATVESMSTISEGGSFGHSVTDEDLAPIVAAIITTPIKPGTIHSTLSYLIGKREVREARGSKILVVDDDMEVVDFVTRTLALDGYPYVSVENGSKVLATLRDDPEIGLVLLDIAMPDLDGFAVCRAIKEDHALRDVLVYIMTAKADPGVPRESFLAGADGHITKPFKTAELLQLVKQLIPPESLAKTT